MYEYALVRELRKTLSLTVTPESQIILKCPTKASDDCIEVFLRRKWLWLEKQLSYFKKYRRKTYVREYVSGESYLYLGRQYKLMVERSSEERVSLMHGVLLIRTSRLLSDINHTKKLLQLWYDKHADEFIRDRFAEMIKKFDYASKPGLIIREMPKRWGSFVGNKRIVINPKLIYSARECIDYVIVHELCHLRYKNHDKKFFTFLDKKYPGWRKVKEKLEMYAV